MRRATAILALLSACQFKLPGSNDWFPCDAGYCDQYGNPVGQGTSGSTSAAAATGGSTNTGTGRPSTGGGTASAGETSSGSGTGTAGSGTSSGGSSGGSTSGRISSSGAGSGSGGNASSGTSSGSMGGSTTGTGTSGGAASTGSGCSAPCLGGSTCEGGTCVCSSIGTYCDGGCTNTDTDPFNCGGCGLACIGQCVSGACKQVTVIATGQCAVNQIALDSQNNAYWTTGDAVYRELIGGTFGTATELFQGDAVGAVGGIAIAETPEGGYAFFGDEISGDVYEVEPSNDIPSTIVVNQPQPYAIAADSENAYWTDFATGTIQRIVWNPLVGHGVVPMDTGLPWGVGIAVDESNVYVASLGDCDAGGGGDVTAIPIDGGAVTTLATSQVFSGSCSGFPGPIIQAFGGSVYWLANGDIMQLSLDGGPSVALGVGAEGTPIALAVDSSGIYWTTSNNEVATCGLSGGPVTVLAANIGSSLGAIATNANTVAWASGDTTNGCPLSYISPK